MMIRVLQIIISYEGKTERMIMNNPVGKKKHVKANTNQFC